jgi:four helix bundle protein
MSCVGEFRDLSVYQRSVELGDALHLSVAAWDSFDRWSIGIQMVRAVDSIGANIAESSGRTRGDQRRFLVIARGSVLELEHWLDRATERGLHVPSNAHADARAVGRMLNGLIKARAQP